MTRRALWLLVGLVSASCGGELTGLAGIYSIDSWSENLNDCTGPGESILDMRSDGAFYVDGEEFFGVEFLNLVFCEDVADCRDKRDQGFLEFGFDDGSDSSGWFGVGATVGGPIDGGDCSGEVRDFSLTSDGDGGVSFSIEARSVDGVPRDDDGFCNTDAAQEAAVGRPCERIEIVEATFAESL